MDPQTQASLWSHQVTGVPLAGGTFLIPAIPHGISITGVSTFGATAAYTIQPQLAQPIVVSTTSTGGKPIMVSIDDQTLQLQQHHHQQAQLLQKQNIDLYLVNDKKEVLEEEDSKDKDMINVLEDDFHTLASSKIKDRLSAFLPDIPGNIDVTDNVESSLRSVIDQPPITGRDLVPLSGSSLSCFRLAPGSLPESYRMDFPRSDSPRRHKKKKKKHKHKQIKLDPSDAMEITSLVTPTLPDTPKAFPPQTELGSESSFSKAGSSHSNPAIIPPKHELMSSSMGLLASGEPVKKKKKKEEGIQLDKDKKKKKKDKKKRKEKEKHFISDGIPHHPLISGSSNPSHP